MSSVAVFVDAGYLFAQGSASITGSQKPRASCSLNETAVAAELSSLAQAKSGGIQLLRIYWYDAARSSHGLSLDHTRLAHTDHIKLRLGFMNSQRKQKGVDSLIVTDMIELARNHAMTDAVLLSGDEDVRIGVQIAQSFGVRVHLLGIKPCRGSQSLQLMQEADTTTEWDESIVSKFLVVSAADVGLTSRVTAETLVTSATVASPLETKFEVVIQNLFDSLDSSDLLSIKTFWEGARGLPSEVDGKLIARCRAEIGRSLEQNEKRAVRSKFSSKVKSTF